MIHLNYTLYANECGYSQAAMDTITAMTRSGGFDIKVRLINSTPNAKALSPSRLWLIRQLAAKPKKKDAYQVLHCIPPVQGKLRNTLKSISATTFEADPPPADWVAILNAQLAVVVPSEFNRRIFEAAGVTKPIYLVPHCIDMELFNPEVAPATHLPYFTFMFCATWRRRKGWLELIQAWAKEFRVKERVCLIIKTDRNDEARKDVKQTLDVLNVKETAPILFEPSIFTEEQMPSVLKCADCIVSPSLGEGFNLVALQAMALQIPLIVTNATGSMDFADQHSATLIEPEGTKHYQSMDGLAQFDNLSWPVLDPEKIAKAMRHVMKNFEEATKKARHGRISVVDRFGYETAAKNWKSMIESLENQ